MFEPFDPKKPVKTRAGRAARIVSENGAGMFPLIAIVTDESGVEHISRLTASGRAMSFPGFRDEDLVNVSEETEEFFNVYLDDLMIVGPKASVEEADDHAIPEERTFTLRVLRTDGDITAVELA